MKLNKKLEAEILKAYNEYWDAYLKGDMRTMSYWMHENVQMIGSGRGEFFKNKKETIKYYKATAKQVAGKADMRNRKISVLPVGDEILVNEECDFFVLIDSIWTFYEEGRLSTLFTKTKNGWKIIQEHGSMPDARTAGGEQVNTNKIKAENVRLKDAVKRRTIELEEKNHELEIETALEKVRAVAMGMHKPNDLLNVCEVMYKEFLSLGFSEIRNAIININNDTDGSFINYDYAEAAGKNFGHFKNNVLPFVDKIIKIGKSKEDAFSETYISGKALVEFKRLRKKTGQKNDPKLNKAKSLYFYFYSIGIGTIGISTFGATSKEKKALLKRFRNVFALAYQRFMDIEKAEAQAREVQIELALEKVRARGMAMQKSDELPQTTFLLFQQLKELGKTAAQVSIGIVNEEKGFVELSATVHGNQMLQTYHIPADEPFMMKKAVKAWKEKKRSLIIKIEGKRLKEYNSWRNSVLKKKIVFPEKQWIVNLVFFSKGMLSFSSDKEVSKETFQLLERFANVFDGTYTRFLDLQNAEKQTREAEIELALERVRAKTMAMQKSDELKETTLVLFQQFKVLGATTAQVSICIFDEETKMGEMFVTLKGEKIDRSFPMEIGKESFVMKKAKKAFLNKQKNFSITIKGKELQNYNRWRNSLIGKKGWDDSEAVRKQAWYVDAVFFSRGMMGISSDTPASDEAIKLLERFANVFDATYTRFNDLKKAEVQARESQIQLALERVRARTMAMQKSDELMETAVVLFNQLNQLGENIERTIIGVMNKEERVVDAWATRPDGSQMEKMQKFPIDEPVVMQKVYAAWKRQKKSIVIDLREEELENYFQFLKGRSSRMKRESFGERRVESFAFFSKGFLGVINADPKTLANVELYERFAAVFDQTYTRFLDLQKSEAQAREAKIEAALERVRARTMAMQRSEDLLDAASLLFKQIADLGTTSWSSGFIIFQPEDLTINSWMSKPDGSMGVPFNIPLTEDLFFIKIYKAYKKGEEFFVMESGGKELAETYRYMFSLPGAAKALGAIEDIGFQMPTFQITHCAFFPQGFLMFITYEACPEMWDIFKRFGKVFEQTYTRFLDLQKAEAQARESQIQLAMERVRARTMAMQNSNELPDAANLLFQQVQSLGMPAWSAGYCIWQEDKNAITAWMSSEGVIQPPFRVPLTEEATFIHMREGWEKGESFYVDEVGGEVCKAHYEYMRTLPSVGKILDSIIEAGHPLPTFQIMHMAYFTQGFLLFITYEPVHHAWDIFKRFAKVFEQTYTRFLDLQKAEAQTKESQIEAALERVRSRTMGMQKSNELKEVIQVVYDQFVHLNIHIEHTGFLMDYKERDDMHIWLADQHLIPSEVTIPFFDSPPNNSIKEAKEKGQDFFKYLLTFEEKNKFYRDLFKFVPGVPEETLEYYFNCPGLAGSGVLLDNIGLYIENFSGISYTDEENNTLMRFGKVFQQTYTRFLDLQKAEAQAREAKIEAALEKVRSGTMAMQKSEDLNRTASDMFKQIQILGMQPWACGFNIFDKNEKAVTQYMSLADAGISPPFRTPLTEDPFFISIYEARQRKEGLLVMESSGKELEETYRYMFGLPGSKEIFGDLENSGFEMPKFQITHCAYFSQGYLVFITYEHVTEAHDIFKRFAKVFEQTYTRFLDLQKAEAQARESQIELGLERVRARAMAMQKSDELSDLVDTVFKELTKLDFALNWCIINIIDESSMSNTVWAASPDINKAPESYHMLFEDYPFHHAMMKGWKERKTKDVYTLEGQEKKIYDEYLFNETEFRKAPEAAQAASRAMEKYVVSFTFSNFGGLQTVGDVPLSDANLDILSRFGKVFDLTYTRFNDLKQAEAQAREAKTEAALEKVRSRTMAMQRSDELSETAAVLFQEFKKLGEEDLLQITIGIYNEAEGLIEFRVTSWAGGGEQVNRPYNLSIEEPTLLKPVFTAWKEGKKSVVIDLTGQQLEDWLKYRNANTGVTVRSQDTGGRRVVSVAFFSKGHISFSSSEPKPSETIQLLERFAGVFDLTYTRFLDLKNAEAQARESQIQLALERVRARTMAMQRSEELSETAAVLFEQLKHVGEKPERAFIGVVNEEEHVIEVWATHHGGTQLNMTVKASIDEPMVMNRMHVAWKAGKKSIVIDLKGDELESYFQYLKGIGAPVSREIFGERRFENIAFFSKGMLGVITPDLQTTESIQLYERFAGVFDLTYTRFLDLQKAEAQAREAKIEVSLERIRARAMAMHKTNELFDAADVVNRELSSLGIPSMNISYAFVDKEEKSASYYGPNPVDGKISPVPFSFPHTETDVMRSILSSWKKQEPFGIIELDEDATIKHQTWVGGYIQYWMEKNKIDTRFSVEEFLAVSPKTAVIYSFNFRYGYLFIIGEERLSTEQEQMLPRFTKVFELAYRRFLDLNQAEAQAREAQIEASLERVRSKTMAMHSSNDVGDTVATMFDEFVKLDIHTNRCGILIFSDEPAGEVWTAKSNPEGKANLIIGKLDLTVHALLHGIHKAWKKKETFYSYSMEGDDLRKYYQALNDLEYYPVKFDMNTLPSKEFHSDFYFPEGSVFTFTTEPLPDEASRVIKRFAAVFGQTYRRYLDLQKAEAQAREATIEAALERVRGKAMAMHSSQDLASTIGAFYQELKLLSVTPRRCGVALIDKETRIAELATMNTTEQGNSIEIIGKLEMTGHKVLDEIFDHWLMQKEYHVILRGNEIKEYYQVIRPQISYPDYPNDVVQFGYYFMFKEGDVYAWTEEELKEEDLQIYRRFTTVLSLTYKRYKDLKDAETRTKDAVKQAALDRIRADIASMRTIGDLNRIIPLIWNELTILGLPFIRCGVFIMDDSQQLIHTFLSTPDGKAIAAFHLPYDTPGNFADVVKNWRNKKIYTDHWDESNFISLADILVKQGAIATKEQYLNTLPHGGFYLHFVPFLQGMLYVGNLDQLGTTEISLIESVADAFSTAYARYEDFNKLEAAKQQVDKTLTDLRQAQQQLVQSEKMASLGELTAGIAHEIQNPLNFVNNFSEVSNELIDEMNAEIEKGDMQEAKAIADDIKQNLEKINHHGKRADAIVKSMLQHSRSSSGKKEPTDINALADEYLRLSYHGLRAKDKSFNAKFEMDLDKTIDKVNIISQDVGRVILNLINNAFYAVTEKKKKVGDGYDPTVTVTTKNRGDKIEIRVIDNGNGIPQKVLDKIFQPFFTTKPTGQGTGLGLSLSYDIITKGHSGELRVETKEGEGTEFIIQLPKI